MPRAAVCDRKVGATAQRAVLRFRGLAGAAAVYPAAPARGSAGAVPPRRFSKIAVLCPRAAPSGRAGPAWTRAKALRALSTLNSEPMKRRLSAWAMTAVVP